MARSVDESSASRLATHVPTEAHNDSKRPPVFKHPQKDWVNCAKFPGWEGCARSNRVRMLADLT